MNFYGRKILIQEERGGEMDVIRLVKKAKKGNKEALLQLIMNQINDY